MSRFQFVLLLALSALTITGCEAPLECSDDPLALETEFELGDPCFADFERGPELDFDHSSSATSDVSHNAGRNCHSCHQSEGPGLGVFTASGTIYTPTGDLAEPGTTVGIYADSDRLDLIAELEVDMRGNIYTTEDLGLADVKRFITVWSADGTASSAMRGAKFNLSCNFCHDSTFQATIDPDAG
jgi:hypothetical protein